MIRPELLEVHVDHLLSPGMVSSLEGERLARRFDTPIQIWNLLRTYYDISDYERYRELVGANTEKLLGINRLQRIAEVSLQTIAAEQPTGLRVRDKLLEAKTVIESPADLFASTVLAARDLTPAEEENRRELGLNKIRDNARYWIRYSALTGDMTGLSEARRLFDGVIDQTDLNTDVGDLARFEGAIIGPTSREELESIAQLAQHAMSDHGDNIVKPDQRSAVSEWLLGFLVKNAAAPDLVLPAVNQVVEVMGPKKAIFRMGRRAAGWAYGKWQAFSYMMSRDLENGEVDRELRLGSVSRGK